MQMQEVLPKMGLKRAGTISVQMGKVTGVRTAALKGTLEAVPIYLTKMERCCRDGLTRMATPLRIQTPLLQKGFIMRGRMEDS